MVSRTILCWLVVCLAMTQVQAGYFRWYFTYTGTCGINLCAQDCKGSLDDNLWRSVNCKRRLYWDCAANQCMCSACYEGGWTCVSRYKC